MPVIVTCTCGQKLRAPDEFVGKKTKCPSCGEIVPIEGEPVPAHDVFVSYSSQDKPTADAACAMLALICTISPMALSSLNG